VSDIVSPDKKDPTRKAWGQLGGKY